MTAAAVEGERQRCLDAGMDDFLTKPVDLHHLGAALARWVPVAEPLALAGRPRTSSGPVHEEPVHEEPVHEEPVHEEPVTRPVAVGGPLDLTRLEMLREMDPGPSCYLLTAIDNFLDRRTEAVAAVRRCVEAGDREGASRAAHQLVGSALNLGVHRVGEAAREVELWDGDLGNRPSAAQLALVEALEAAIADAVPALRAYRTEVRERNGRESA